MYVSKTHFSHEENVVRILHSQDGPSESPLKPSRHQMAGGLTSPSLLTTSSSAPASGSPDI